MSRPLILDAFCGAGGAGMGYYQAGFDVIGVDIDPQPDYPFAFIQADALAIIATHGRKFAAIHASPPCQASTALTKGNRKRAGWTDEHINMIPATRELLKLTGKPFVLENVQGSDVRRDLTLCGEMFGLGVIRHRYFELGGGWSMEEPAHIKHRGRVAGWRHGIHYDGPYCAVYGDGGGKGTIAEWQQAMSIDWMTTRHDLAESIPPSYSRFIGAGLLEHLTAKAAA